MNESKDRKGATCSNSIDLDDVHNDWKVRYDREKRRNRVRGDEEIKEGSVV